MPSWLTTEVLVGLIALIGGIITERFRARADKNKGESAFRDDLMTLRKTMQEEQDRMRQEYVSVFQQLAAAKAETITMSGRMGLMEERIQLAQQKVQDIMEERDRLSKQLLSLQERVTHLERLLTERDSIIAEAQREVQIAKDHAREKEQECAEITLRLEDIRAQRDTLIKQLEAFQVATTVTQPPHPTT